MRIALLDSHTDRAERHRQLLSMAGYRCHVFDRLKLLLTTTLRDTFDLVVLVGVPDDTALRRALLAICERDVAPPVMLLLEHALDGDVADLLDTGADACLRLPCSDACLVAQVRALLRRTPQTRPHVHTRLRFDAYAFDPVGGSVEIDAVRIQLTPKELALALVLFRNIGRDLSRQYLTDGVWARESGPGSRSLDTHISRIRQKLWLNAEKGFQLSAIYSHGYRLDRVIDEFRTAEVCEVQAEAAGTGSARALA